MQCIPSSLLILILSFFLALSTSGNPTANPRQPSHKRTPQIRHMHLGDNWHVHFRTFTPFGPTYAAALGLSYFWSEIATQVSTIAWMPDDQFLSNVFSLRMALGQDLELVFEVFDLSGPVTREFVAVVAGMMMDLTMGGFCGTFNARLRREEDVVWIVVALRESLGG